MRIIVNDTLELIYPLFLGVVHNLDFNLTITAALVSIKLKQMVYRRKLLLNHSLRIRFFYSSSALLKQWIWQYTRTIDIIYNGELWFTVDGELCCILFYHGNHKNIFVSVCCLLVISRRVTRYYVVRLLEHARYITVHVISMNHFVYIYFLATHVRCMYLLFKLCIRNYLN